MRFYRPVGVASEKVVFALQEWTDSCRSFRTQKRPKICFLCGKPLEPFFRFERCCLMRTVTLERLGGCACDALRFIVRGEALRVGICHCLVCQKAHGAPYFAFAVFPRAAVSLSGPHVRWESSLNYHRLYCAACGSRFANLVGNEVELPVASFAEAAGLVPQYENWTIRRLPWVTPLAVRQFERDPEK
ncbi:hypothetical protein SPH9361_03634 [Sphingobium sp. CECT 9361]|nr:hypothetical protein SPH9361_03634 [Sphingobium sp. CECT 9361]